MDDLDLIEQYFLRELTEDEKKALDELIEKSPEAAGLFQEKAKAVSPPYRLPELKLPPLPLQPPPRSGSIPLSNWLWVLAGYGLLAGAFWLWSRNHDFHWPWDQTEPLSSAADSPARKVLKTASQAGWGRNPGSPLADETGTDNDLALAMGAQPTPEDQPNEGVTPVPVSSLSPNPGNPGLRVLVERPIPGLVTVTVLNSMGEEIRTLYDGALQAGRWAIDWDGHLANGDKAPIGSYTLQVRSGSKVQKQEVWIGQ